MDDETKALLERLAKRANKEAREGHLNEFHLSIITIEALSRSLADVTREKDAAVEALREAGFELLCMVERCEFPNTYDRLLALCDPEARATQEQSNG